MQSASRHSTDHRRNEGFGHTTLCTALEFGFLSHIAPAPGYSRPLPCDDIGLTIATVMTMTGIPRADQS